jgi:ABC-type Fe3+-hydroxamate transport system substrate-binding protein
VPESPQRIISLVPSQTELLYDLGLGNRVVGLTKFCVHPAAWLRQKTIVGGTKQFRFDVIDSLQPDLIIGNKEENYQEGIDRLAENYSVWMSDITTVSDALEMITQVAAICGKASEAKILCEQIRTGFKTVAGRKSGRVVYLIWNKPYMAAGPETFIHEMLSQIGFENCVKQARYPELSEAMIKEMNPDHILLSSEPYPFKQEHAKSLQALLPNAKISLVDGEMFSWYGSRMLKFPAYLSKAGWL